MSSQAAPVPVAPTTERAAPAVAVRRRRHRWAARLGWNALGLFVFAVMVFPVYWMVNTAFKPGVDIQSYTPKFVPSPATLRNFTDAIHRDYFWDVVKNSVIVVAIVTVLSLVLAFLAALVLPLAAHGGAGIRRPR